MEKHSASGASAGGNASLMREIKGERPNRIKLTGRLWQLEFLLLCNHGEHTKHRRTCTAIPEADELQQQETSSGSTSVILEQESVATEGKNTKT